MPAIVHTRTSRCQLCGNNVPAHTMSLIGGQRACPLCIPDHFVCVNCHEVFLNYDRSPSQARTCCYTCDDLMACWDATPVQFDGVTTELKSARRYGIELETSRCEGYRELRGDTVYGAKYDGSIRGMEFVSPILQGDKGLWVTRGLCARVNHRGFTVDSDCGLHLHIDVSNNTDIQRRHIACAYAYTYPVWCRLVNTYRAHDCSYCHSLNWDADQMRTTYRFSNFCNCQNRYSWFNVYSLEQHGTFEIRLHEGTLDSRRICNWVKAHTRFADYVQDMKFQAIRDMFEKPAKQMWKAVTNTWNDPALRRYFRRVARLHD